MHTIGRRYRYSVILLRELVRTDFKLRYQGSLLGYMWSLLRPLLMFLILYLVFSVFLPVGKGVPYYPQYLLIGIVLWNYFSEITTGSVGAIVGKSDLLRKINFPKYVIILAVALSATINLLLNSVVVAVFIFFGHVPIGWHALLVLPLVLELFVLALAAAFWLSALFVRFRDVQYIWDVVMQAAFYATPILYALQRVPHKYSKFMILNPAAQVIQDSRHVLTGHYALTISQLYGGDKLIWIIPIAVTIIAMLSGAWYFRSRSKYFAEEV